MTDFEPLTPAQLAVIQGAAPKVRGKVVSSLLPIRAVPAMTREQVALHAGISGSQAFSLENAVKRGVRPVSKE